MSKKSSARLSKKQKQKIVSQLQRENRRLRKENEYLRHLAMQYDMPEEEKITPEQQILADSVKRADTLRSKSYFGYLMQCFRRSRPFLIFDKTRFAMKGIRFAKKMWVFFIGFFTFLGIGAQFLLIFGSLAVFIPAALIASAVIGIYSYFAHRKRDKIFRPLYSEDYDGKIYLVFLQKKQKDRYFVRCVPQLTQNGHVFLITTSFRECGGRSVVPIEERVCKMHISAYFSFVRRLPSDKVVKVYL